MIQYRTHMSSLMITEPKISLYHYYCLSICIRYLSLNFINFLSGEKTNQAKRIRLLFIMKRLLQDNKYEVIHINLNGEYRIQTKVTQTTFYHVKKFRKIENKSFMRFLVRRVICVLLVVGTMVGTVVQCTMGCFSYFSNTRVNRGSNPMFVVIYLNRLVISDPAMPH